MENRNSDMFEGMNYGNTTEDLRYEVAIVAREYAGKLAMEVKKLSNHYTDAGIEDIARDMEHSLGFAWREAKWRKGLVNVRPIASEDILAASLGIE